MHPILQASRRGASVLLVPLCAGLLWGCNGDRGVEPRATRLAPAADLGSPTKPNFNLEVILRPTGAGDGFGHVTFRQNNDDATVVDLGVWVRDLAPNTHYRLQRAVDPANVLDDVCASQTWLTLGLGAVAQDIVTDDRGTGVVDLFRVLTTPGNAFDIHFRVVTATTSPTAVLESECYQFFVR
jgi:hypothetical protein